ncbi:MAG: trypsin-like peptidase domain-containing protein [Oscillospiraceae bacterium]|jgi:serine protease Do
MDNDFNNTNHSDDNENFQGYKINDDSVTNKDESRGSFTNYQRELPVLPVFTNSINEVAYYPEDIKAKKKISLKRIFKSVAAVFCVLLISMGSVAGYIVLTDNGARIPFYSSEVKSDDSSEADSSSISDDSSEAESRTTPSLLQLAAKENALSVPDIVKKVSPSVVGISSKLYNGTSTGTGIIMTSDGYIITNGHVVEDATEITVVISTDDELEECEAKLIGIDKKTDLAVIKVKKTELIPAEFGTSEELEVGELAIAIGNPLGFELAGSVTGGIISALNRELTVEDKQMTLIQTDAAINPGNSVGPLVNSYGQVIGINSVKISSSYSTSTEGLGFAIPIDEAKPIVDDLIEYGYVKGRPMLGISGEDITSVIARYYDLPQGVIVRFIEPDSGAENGGIKIGDIIIGIDNKAITSMAELNEIKDTFKAGETVKLAIYRDGENIDLYVVLSEATAVN